MRSVLDSGALIALERNDRAMWRRLKLALIAEAVPLSHGGVVGQAWRGRGPRQALLAKALDGVEIRPLDRALGRAAGELLALAGRSDVVDAALVLLAPPVAQERVEQRPCGLVRITLKKAYTDGTIAVDMDPLSLPCRLA